MCFRFRSSPCPNPTRTRRSFTSDCSDLTIYSMIGTSNKHCEALTPLPRRGAAWRRRKCTRDPLSHRTTRRSRSTSTQLPRFDARSLEDVAIATCRMKVTFGVGRRCCARWMLQLGPAKLVELDCWSSSSWWRVSLVDNQATASFKVPSHNSQLSTVWEKKTAGSRVSWVEIFSNFFGHKKIQQLYILHE